MPLNWPLNKIEILFIQSSLASHRSLFVKDALQVVFYYARL